MRVSRNRALGEKLCFAFIIIAVLFAVLATGCKDDDDDNDECVPGTTEGCPEGFVCEDTAFGEGEPACFAPVVIRGDVFDLATSAGIAGALVVARDADGAAMGTVAVTDVDGNYSLWVPVVRLDEEGGFEGEVLTLRVDAAGYQSYPGGFRPSLPVDLDDAVETDADGDTEFEELTVETPTTSVALIPLPDDTSSLGTISGNAPDGFGALVVAQGSAGAVTGVADSEGNWAIFNVPAGSYALRAYASEKQYSPLNIDMSAGEEKVGIDFELAEIPLAEVSGSVNIVNAPGGSVTSVVLVVEATFNENFTRGEVPPGLRAGEVTGAFAISGVPDGRYVVLAAFENDDLVRDPDPSIGGTQIVHIEVSGGSLVNTETLSFKVTEALAMDSPGAEEPEAVTGTPTFSWADDSSEDAYSVIVYDAFGQVVWEDTAVPSVSGEALVNVEYGGGALGQGIYYQWRATSIRKDVPISTTEDLRGLFFLQ